LADVATIDLTELPIDVDETPRADLERALDEACRKQLGVSGDEFKQAVREGTSDLLELPAAVELRVFARALIDSE
jgi:hypothetical protein